MRPPNAKFVVFPSVSCMSLSVGEEGAGGGERWCVLSSVQDDDEVDFRGYERVNE